MRKKKETTAPPPNTQPVPPPADFQPTGIRLTDAQYWKWRLTIEEMQHAASLRDLRNIECKYKELELQNGALQLRELRTKHNDQVKAVEASKSEYDLVKKEIETQLGVSLNQCVIDDLTWEVKKLPSP
jgi:hypothetical protein